MAKIRIVGDSSGYVELSAPNAAGNNTLELPSNATKLVGADASNSLNVTGIATFSSGITVGTGASVSSPATNVLTLGTNNVERVRVSAAGSFGFNTTSPQSPIDIGAGSASAPTYKGTIRIQPSDAQSTNSNGGIEFLASSYSNGYGYRLSNPDLGGGQTPFIIESRSDSVTWTERMRIDSSGRVTMPYQPAFFATSNSGTITVSVGNYFPFNVLNTTFAGSSRNSGYNTSTYLYTAPVTGLYQFYVQFYLNPSSVINSITWWKNGSQLSYEDAAINVFMNTNSSTTPSNIILNGAVILELSANDTVGIKPRTGNPNGINLYMNHSSFWGYLVG